MTEDIAILLDAGHQFLPGVRTHPKFLRYCDSVAVLPLQIPAPGDVPDPAKSMSGATMGS